MGIGLAVAFAAVGLYQSITHDLLFFAPNLEVSNANSDFFRVTSLFGDPSLYGRHVVLGIGVLLVLLALQRVDLRLGVGLLVVMWAGLLFSYSQSSMVALVAITLAVAVATGGRNLRLLVVGGVALVTVLGVGYLVASVVDPRRVASHGDRGPVRARGGHHRGWCRTSRSWASGSGDSRAPAASWPRATAPPPPSCRTRPPSPWPRSWA